MAKVDMLGTGQLFRDCEAPDKETPGFHNLPPPNPPSPPPKTCPCRSLHSSMNSYTFPHKEERVLKGVFGGREGGGVGDL